MRTTKKYNGIIVPAVTPLTKSYQLDEQAVERIFNLFYQYYSSPFILGTTGEANSLPLPLKKDFLRAAAKYKKAGTVLYAGISSNVVEESIEFARLCVDHGVDAVATTLPSYYALREDQMKRYFETLANALPLPLIIYNIPGTTHMSIPLELIDELSFHPNVIATKDSERSDERLQQSLALWKDRPDFSHFLGWAARSAHALLNGTDGLIPSTGNLVPGIYAEMVTAVNNGDEKKAYQLQEQSDRYGDLYQAGKTLGESLWALKVLLKEEGLCEPHVMPPLQEGTKEEETRLVKQLNEFKMK